MSLSLCNESYTSSALPKAIITHLTIVRLGKLSRFETSLDSCVNILKTEFSEEIILALTVLLNVTPKPVLPTAFIHDNTLILADILCSNEQYTVKIMPDTDKKELVTAAFDRYGNDVTRKYLYEMSHCADEDKLVLFDAENSAAKDLIYGYYNRDTLTSSENHIKKDVNTQAFRLWLRKFAQNSPPEPISRGGNLKAALNTDGNFSVISDSNHFELSEQEKAIFNYICHLKALSLWDGFEEIRNFHYIKKPIIVRLFSPNREKTNSEEEFIEKMNVGRQVITFTK